MKVTDYHGSQSLFFYSTRSHGTAFNNWP
jgi:hypothetical protein